MTKDFETYPENLPHEGFEYTQEAAELRLRCFEVSRMFSPAVPDGEPARAPNMTDMMINAETIFRFCRTGKKL